MSSSLSSIEHNVYAMIDGQRVGQSESVIQSLEGMDIEPQEASLRSKLKRFWKKTRIPTVVKKFVAGSKSLLNRLNPRFTPNATSPRPQQTGEVNATARVEIVKFPDYMIPSPTSSSNVPSPDASVGAPNLNIHFKASIPTSSPSPRPIPAPIPLINDSIDAEKAIPSAIAKENFSSDFRFKEKLGKQKSFPEIKFGVVSSRVKWLEPRMSGKKTVDRTSNEMEDGVLRDDRGGKSEDAPQALEIHESSVLAPGGEERNSEEVPNSSESDNESTFDDSPRLYKHRLPEEEPKPWVEPGTVARGAMWLYPVMSGEKRTGSGDSDSGNLTSPTRIVRAVFH